MTATPVFASKSYQTTAHAAFLSQRRFGSLDGLRATSIVAVIWHHTAPLALAGATIVNTATHGVTLFFAISGFLITTLVLRERDRNGEIDLKAFYVRCALHIFSLYYAVLALYIVIVLLLERDLAFRQDFFYNLRYFTRYTSNIFVRLDGRVIFCFSWSLATEEQFYLVWPPLLRLIRRPEQAFVLLLAAFVILVADQFFATQLFSGVPGGVPIAIVGGVLLAICLHMKRTFRIIYTVLGRPWSVPICASLLLLSLLQSPAATGIYIFSVSLVGACVIHEDHPLVPTFSLPMVSYIGTISYGMYLLHMLCKNASLKLLSVARLSTDRIAVFALTLVVTVLVAGLSFRYFESYFLKLKTSHTR